MHKCNNSLFQMYLDVIMKKHKIHLELLLIPSSFLPLDIFQASKPKVTWILDEGFEMLYIKKCLYLKTGKQLFGNQYMFF